MAMTAVMGRLTQQASRLQCCRLVRSMFSCRLVRSMFTCRLVRSTLSCRLVRSMCSRRLIRSMFSRRLVRYYVQNGNPHRLWPRHPRTPPPCALPSVRACASILPTSPSALPHGKHDVSPALPPGPTTKSDARKEERTLDGRSEPDALSAKQKSLKLIVVGVHSARGLRRCVQDVLLHVQCPRVLPIRNTCTIILAGSERAHSSRVPPFICSTTPFPLWSLRKLG